MTNEIAPELKQEYASLIHDYISDPAHRKTVVYDLTLMNGYTDGYMPRFLAGINLILKNCVLGKNARILEYGASMPFFSLLLTKKFGCLGVSKDLTIRGFNCVGENLFAEHGNICTDEMSPLSWDLIIMTEVWEHLPCSLLTVKANVLKALKPNGYLLCSYPLKGVNSDPKLWGNVMDEDWTVDHGHLREFTEETAKKFVTELPVVGQETVFSPAYAWYISSILYKKEASK